MREFAEQEIICPNGPYPNRRFKTSRQPWTAHWFDAIDSGLWQRFAMVKPSQTGGTLCGLAIPTAYHLFEIGEDVICGLPSIQMAQDKWEKDLKPVIERSGYRDLIPTTGRGSRGGRFESITFGNGATLKFISGGGDDKKRAGYTARVVAITEVDGMDEAGETSREADKVKQMEARARAFGDKKRIYLECTASIEKGRIWQEYVERGTTSRLVMPCPACPAWVSPDREDLAGWKGRETAFEAKAHGRISCPECGKLWSEKERAEANERAVLVHRGEELGPDGDRHGSPPLTDTFSLRVTAVNNLFDSMGSVAADEWRADRIREQDGEESEEFENAELELHQFTWALPWIPPSHTVDQLNAETLQHRTAVHRGRVPAGAVVVTVGADLGRHVGHWAATAWMPTGHGVVFDYGRFEVASASLGEDNAIKAALRELNEQLEWPTADGSGPRTFDAAFPDARYGRTGVFAFVREREADGDRRWRPLMGFGQSTYGGPRYSRPGAVNRGIVHVGDEYHLRRFREDRVVVVEVNVDHWKGVVHDGLICHAERRGAITLCHDDSGELQQFVKHLLAEKRVRNKKGLLVWEQERKANHWLDSCVYAVVAAHACGVRFVVVEGEGSDAPVNEDAPEEAWSPRTWGGDEFAAR